METLLVPHSALTRLQVEQLRLLEVEPEQLSACGDIASALYTLATTSADAITGWALLVDQHPRAFLLLMRAPCVPAWADPLAAVVLALQVDRQHQGRGLGKACLQALPDAVRRTWPEINQLTLSVDPRNTAALQLYRSQGWVDRGEAYRAKVGFERKFVFEL
ncbi:GNAT family N-acetyltransferase [Pseudomonas sp. RIT-PI-S]|uniref:GNAT family N-acetyltransferase n=1 Tax=Pseudomonas sp. RIT-PI-S TaxID=3035295 RepID=UPI0021DB09E1|nr:GNAT family N-acetyltransferase [Pseudomonas sp. RIT-PI-S]